MNRIFLIACAVSMWSSNTGFAVQTQVPIIDIEIFLDNGTINNRGDEDNAIDGNINTVSFLTNAGELNPNIAALNFGTTVFVNRIRVAKQGDTDEASNSGIPGQEPLDNMDLTILFSTDSGPLESRTYQAVSGLTNGFQGTELINADTVNSFDGTVDNDHHDFTNDGGFYSLTFNPVSATAIAIRFARDAGDTQDFTHYSAFEIEVYDSGTMVPTLTEWGIILLIVVMAVAAVFQVKKLRLSEHGV